MRFFWFLCFIIYGFSIDHSRLNAQNGVSIYISGIGINNVDSAKSVFGLNVIRYTISNTSYTEVGVRPKGSEFKIGNNNWVKMPDISLYIFHSENIPLTAYDSIRGRMYISLFNLYWDESFSMQSLIASGGIIDYRLVFDVYSPSTNADYTIYSPVVQILVPPATQQDAAALQYVIQQKSACPEMEYFFANFDASTLGCNYAYEYISDNFPETALAKVSKYYTALRNCRNHRSEINSLPEVKASIINTRNMLLSSDIPYIKQLANNLSCANN